MTHQTDKIFKKTGKISEDRQPAVRIGPPMNGKRLNGHSMAQSLLYHFDIQKKALAAASAEKFDSRFTFKNFKPALGVRNGTRHMKYQLAGFAKSKRYQTSYERLRPENPAAGHISGGQRNFAAVLPNQSQTLMYIMIRNTGAAVDEKNDVPPAF